jgi:hypothetical protein
MPSRKRAGVPDYELSLVTQNINTHDQGRIQGGGGGGGRRPPKIRKNMIFWRKIVIFHTKYPNNFRASLRNWKKYDFLV